ncbi:FtsK/SpoIIIE domain-containing protein [Timonella sp. A28]|uniref:FtsK/SpoIIIE domain-containing protein n=1 Tax=Timonella sp. A28 TaxID=3442640 RepID=UPI003EBADFAE
MLDNRVSLTLKAIGDFDTPSGTPWHTVLAGLSELAGLPQLNPTHTTLDGKYLAAQTPLTNAHHGALIDPHPTASSPLLHPTGPSFHVTGGPHTGQVLSHNHPYIQAWFRPIRTRRMTTTARIKKTMPWTTTSASTHHPRQPTVELTRAHGTHRPLSTRVFTRIFGFRLRPEDTLTIRQPSRPRTGKENGYDTHVMQWRISPQHRPVIHANEPTQTHDTDEALITALPIISALIPFTLSIALAIFLKQPYMLLFGLAGPLIAGLQVYARSSSRAKQREKSSTSTSNDTATSVNTARGLHANVFEAALPDLIGALRDYTPPHPTRTPQPRYDITPDNCAHIGSWTTPSSLGAARATILRLLCLSAFPLLIDPNDTPLSLVIVCPRAAASEWSWLRWLHPTMVFSSDSTRLQADSQRAALDRNNQLVIVDERAVNHTTHQSVAETIVAPATACVVVRQTHAHATQQSTKTCPLDNNPLTVGRTNYEELTEQTAEQAIKYLRRALQQRTPHSNELPQTAALSQCSALAQPTSPAATHNDLIFEVGLGAHNTQVRFDLVSDGPHVLVAGTTGAGKSEFLRTFIMTLAARYSPKHLSFVLVDYKGGAGLAPCASLPHNIGLVTDLDPSETTRALSGLQRELKRREHLFADTQTTRLEEYNALQSITEPLPRLVIVVDEFRALSDDHPDFINDLVRLAAQGRSLGIHLVLATQRPAGAITADMRANLTLRICLRVADEQDSVDVIGTPEAAHLPRNAPGRLLIHAGSGERTLAQSYFSGKSRERNVTVRRLNNWHEPLGGLMQKRTKQVSHTEHISHIHGKHTAHAPLWAPSLPELFSTPSSTADASLDSVSAVLPPQPFPLAVASPMDAVAHTFMFPLDASGNIQVLGGTKLGKTTFLLNAAASYANAGFTVHWLGTAHELTTADAVLRQFGAAHTTTSSSDAYLTHAVLKQLCMQPNPTQHVLIIDGFEELHATLESFNRGSGTQLLEHFATHYGTAIRQVMMSTSRKLPHRLEQYFERRFLFGSGNRDDDRVLGIPADLAGIPAQAGRGIVLDRNLAMPFRVAHLTVDTQADTLRRYAPASAQDCATDLGSSPLIQACSLRALDEVPPHFPVRCGFSGEPLLPEEHSTWLIAGSRRSGRTTLLNHFATFFDSRTYTVFRFSATARGSDSVSTIAAHTLETLRENVKNAQNYVVLIDDFDRIPAADALHVEQLIEFALTAGTKIIVTATVQAINQAFRGPLAQLRELGTGILLAPHVCKEREFLDTPIGEALDPTTFFGRAVMTSHGVAHPARIYSTESTSRL